MKRLAHVWRFGLLFVLPLVLLASFARGTHAQVENSATHGKPSEAGTVIGVVTDHRGTPLAGSGVIVTTPGGKQVASSTTDAGGAFRVVDLQPGDYLLHVTAKGFYKVTQKIKIKPRKTEKTDIKMKFIPIEMN